MAVLPSPPRHRFLPALTLVQLEQIDRRSAVLVLPVASVEQHGPHLPLYTDSLVVEAVLAEAVARAGERLNIWTLPLLAYGRSTEHGHFPGTLTLSAATLARVLLEIAGGLSRSGFRKLVLLNGHGGNVSTLDTVARDIRAETGMLVFVTGTGLSANLPEGTMDPLELQWGLHAGALETSAVLAVAPHAVDLERASGHRPRFVEQFDLVGPTKGMVRVAWLADDLAANGVIGDPTAASEELGRVALEGAVSFLCAALEEVAAFEFPRGR
ncbi:MAG TPA: creatininase family protein [Dehalococcoidia bacterium]